MISYWYALLQYNTCLMNDHNIGINGRKRLLCSKWLSLFITTKPPRDITNYHSIITSKHLSLFITNSHGELSRSIILHIRYTSNKE